MFPDTPERVRRHTSREVNRRIDAAAADSARFHARRPERIERRLRELDAEWDIERTLEANAATLALTGTLRPHDARDRRGALRAEGAQGRFRAARPGAAQSRQPGQPRAPGRPPMNRRGRRIPGWVSGAIVLGAFAAIIVGEARRPLRPERKEPKLRRNLRNVAVAGLSAATLQLLEKPVVEPLSRRVERRGWGLLQQVPLPGWAETALAILLMDYTLYLWHVAAHRSETLWRFHKVHHVDLDMDASTALRFHFAEMAISVPYRAAQVALIGVAPRPLSIWQTLLFVSILFHHSDLRLPSRIERRLVNLIVTPRMHGIHHSIIEAETNSNWSSGLTVWDRLHGTLRLDLLDEEMEIGVAAYRDPAEVTFPRLVEMPFTDTRPAWLLPNGERPRRLRSSEQEGGSGRELPDRIR